MWSTYNGGHTSIYKHSNNALLAPLHQYWHQWLSAHTGARLYACSRPHHSLTRAAGPAMTDLQTAWVPGRWLLLLWWVPRLALAAQRLLQRWMR